MTDKDTTADRDVPSAKSWPTLGSSFLEFFALSGIAFAQPMFDLLSKSTGLFYTRGTTGIQTIALTLLVLLVPPLACLGIEAVAGALFPRIRPWVHVAFGGVFFGVIAAEILKKATQLGPHALVVAGVVGGVLGAALLLKVDIVRQFLRLLSVAPVIFAVLFLVASPVSDVVFNTGAKASTVDFSRPKRVVFVLFDEFPEMSLLNGSGHIDSGLYPNFAAFADNSTWYRNETTLAPYTERAVPAILTGDDPPQADVPPEVSDYPNNLFTLLGKRYGMNVHEPVTRMCPQQICKSASGTGFGSLINQSLSLWESFASPHRTAPSFNFDAVAEGALGTGLDVAKEFVASIKPAKQPELDYAHIEMPHQPWQLLPTLQRYPQSPILAIQWPDPASAMVARERHLLQVQATDTMLGQIVAKLKSVGAYNDSLIVVSADHGVAFTSGQPIRAATDENFSQVMWPPLLIKYPGERTGRVDDRPAQSVDILPTIAQVIGVKVPWHLDGSSLLGPVKPDFPRRLFQYHIAQMQPASAPTPPPGHKFITFNAGVGFPEVLKGRAAPPGGDPKLRLYRLGEYGGLVGKRAGPYIDGRSDAGLSIRDLAKFNAVNKSATVLPWAYDEGFIGPVTGLKWVAIVINGTIATVTPTEPLKDNGEFLEFLVPPELIRDGKNSVSAYLVSGTPAAPQLASMSLGNSKY
jgi:uncharacterized membrane protein YeaQ/YmgE (transglycosylase-associated protein family)